MLNEGNPIHNFISSSGTGTVINYGSGSASQKVTVPTVPVPQHCQTQTILDARQKQPSCFSLSYPLTLGHGSPTVLLPYSLPLPGMSLDW
jgi:hypothetical protein